MADYMPTKHFFLDGSALQIIEDNADLPDDANLIDRELAVRLRVTYRWLRGRRQQGNGPKCTVHETVQRGHSGHCYSHFTYRWGDVRAWLQQRADHHGIKCNVKKFNRARTPEGGNDGNQV
jgi:hypothetical protein